MTTTDEDAIETASEPVTEAADHVHVHDNGANPRFSEKQPSPVDRSRMCYEAIGQALTQFGCRFAPKLEVDQTSNGKAIVTTTWTVEPIG